MELIDLQLLITHVIAFLLVLWLLRRFAWGPVLQFLERRRAGIAGEFARAAEDREQAETLRRDYEGRLQEVDVEARRRMQAAVAEGHAAAARIKEEAQTQRRQRLERAEDEVQRLEESAREMLRHRTVDLAILAAEKAIAERLDDPSHRRLIERYIDELDAAPRQGDV
ncbi:MAG: F0F1 ATP synthase subunit B [Candidatus Eisenbacteria bacterium]